MLSTYIQVRQLRNNQMILSVEKLGNNSMIRIQSVRSHVILFIYFYYFFHNFFIASLRLELEAYNIKCILV